MMEGKRQNDQALDPYNRFFISINFLKYDIQKYRNVTLSFNSSSGASLVNLTKASVQAIP